MDDDYWVEESSWKPSVSKKRKRRIGKRKIEYVGWGSRPLIEFLEAIGQDTSKKQSQHEVAAFITKYINDNGLSCPQKKKKVLCDERLLAIFGKKSIIRTKVYDLLEDHFAENLDDSDSEFLDSSEDENNREQNSGLKNKSSGQIKKIQPKSCFAAIIPENIKLVYLKRNLIQELLKDPESFESKMVGSIIRMKSDPHDIYQKNRFQLQLVTGLEKISGDGDAATEIHLRVANFHKEVPLSMLSDDNFAEEYVGPSRELKVLRMIKTFKHERMYKTSEEIKDMQDRIKAGLLKRLTVIELEAKARMLHANITKHWIEKELSVLQKLIDRANEKGWRRELFDYLDRRKLLQTPSEQEKLMLKIPEVIAEELEPEGIVAGGSEKAEGSGRSPKSILRGNSDVSSTDASGSGDHVTPSRVTFEESHAFRGQNGCIIRDAMLDDNPNAEDQPSDIIEQKQISNIIRNGSSEELSHIMNLQTKNPQENREATELRRQSAVHPSLIETRQQSAPSQVIELSDDDEPEAKEPNGEADVGGGGGECPESIAWHYSDPQGRTQGPFSLYSLKRWNDANYFHPDFKVWKEGQSLDDAVLLADVLSQTFP